MTNPPKLYPFPGFLTFADIAEALPGKHTASEVEARLRAANVEVYRRPGGTPVVDWKAPRNVFGLKHPVWVRLRDILIAQRPGY